MDCPLNKEVICTNWVCTKHGCQRLGGSTTPVMANPVFQRGCICPPTSEQTCMNPDCGRKARDQA